MDPIVGALGAAGAMLWALGGLVLVHHKLKHSDPENTQTLLPPDQQWFQRKDVCAARSTHENWVVACVVAGAACLCAAVIIETVDRSQNV